MNKPDNQFSLNRTITFGMLLTLSVQTASGLIWAGAAEARLHMIETQLAARLPAFQRLALVEGQMEMIRESLVRIEKRVSDEADAERQK